MRLGIFGGAFSPPHNGHIAMAAAFRRQMCLDRLLIMPTGISPHKLINMPCENDCGGKIRYEMLKIAFNTDENGINASEKTEISRFELDSGETNYTYKTLSAFSGAGTELYFLCGEDMFLTLDGWKNPDIIFSLAVIAVAARKNDGMAFERINEAKKCYERIFGARISVIDAPPLEISSGAVREKIHSGEDVAELVPKELAGFIRLNRLYI